MPSPPRPLLVLTWVVPILVLLQALLAGQAWFQGADLFGLHGGLGHSVLLLAIVVAAWSWFAPVRRSAAVLATVNVVALIGQTGLGYAGHRGGAGLASSLHIPLGATILAAAVAVALLASLPQVRTDTPVSDRASRAR